MGINNVLIDFVNVDIFILSSRVTLIPKLLVVKSFVCNESLIRNLGAIFVPL